MNSPGSWGTVNIKEMLVRYVFFQMLNISPCTNVYMVTGRVLTYRLGELTDPGQEAFVRMFAAISRFMQLMGIRGRIGAYAGTKECHDVQFGMYVTLNGDIYPCPGYEGIHSLIGSLRTHSIADIWKNNPHGKYTQSICPPKIGTHFPPNFEQTVEDLISKECEEYDTLFHLICENLCIG